ncbi:TPA: helix-turn-helix domain-containing protein, partial [Escherichia coli]|nr:helix-turn-helix domain-containing protein [Escherichia coli]HAI5484578.1 helix-turn-helix domain-containing protein [Escherichia coli]
PSYTKSVSWQHHQIAHQLSIARSTVYKILEDERAS